MNLNCLLRIFDDRRWTARALFMVISFAKSRDFATAARY